MVTLLNAIDAQETTRVIPVHDVPDVVARLKAGEIIAVDEAKNLYLKKEGARAYLVKGERPRYVRAQLFGLKDARTYVPNASALIACLRDAVDNQLDMRHIRFEADGVRFTIVSNLTREVLESLAEGIQKDSNGACRSYIAPAGCGALEAVNKCLLGARVESFENRLVSYQKLNPARLVEAGESIEATPL